jgi:very-short-patch-repair endonuclease
VVSARSASARRPKTLVFATLSKPDLRFLDLLNNDIEVLGDPDDTLIYDRPIGVDGVLWRDLQGWWQGTRQITDDADAKASLYAGLRRCLPGNSPSQRNLFDLYHQIHGPDVPGLPALLPEVRLHWDPRTVRQRGIEAMLRFRMDFLLLLLLPAGRRVVVEVDGEQHYSTQGKADRAKYAATVRGVRDLKLSGYEVFRFGTEELRDLDLARPLVQQFFADLFREFDVTPRIG